MVTKLASCLALTLLLLRLPAAWAEPLSDAESFAQWRAQAETGEAAAQYSVGWCHHTGKGVERNLAEAERWYRKAAAQGHAARSSLPRAVCRDRRLPCWPSRSVCGASPMQRRLARGGH